MSAPENNVLNDELNSVPQNVRIKLSSYSSSALDRAVGELITTSKRIGAVVVGAIPLPNLVVSYSVNNKSTHRMTKSKDKMLTTKHRRLIILLDADSNTVNALSGITIAPGVGVDIQIEIVNNSNHA